MAYCLFVIQSENEMNILICGYAGEPVLKVEFLRKIYITRVMELESGLGRFRVPKTPSQGKGLVNDAVLASTKYKNNWAVKDYDLHKVIALSN